MRTLVFCTAFAEEPSVWAERYRPWVDTVMAGGLAADQVLLVDDGSASLPGWADTQLVSVDGLGDAYTMPSAGRVVLAHFRARRGRRDILDFPGWHRSFCFAALYADRQRFDRVIHIESDACVISARAREFLTVFRAGWAAFWSARYDMPESAIQVAAGEGVRALAQFARAPYDALIGRTHERMMPFTHVEKRFSGDRYGEFGDAVPPDADYAAQIPTRRERGFSWFRPGHRAVPPAGRQVVLRFCAGGDGPGAAGGDGPGAAGGDGRGALREGWAAPEPRHHWMLGAESTLTLPALEGAGDAVLRLRVTPHVRAPVLMRQRLILEVNGQRLREYVVPLEAVLGCDVPAGLLGRAGGDVLRLIHPDAAAPCDLAAGVEDARRLAVSLEWLTFER
jgi:hypothetical protein